MSRQPAKFAFYCDENFPVPAGEVLKSRGHNIVKTPRSMRGKSDSIQLTYASKSRRILLTFDPDFEHSISSEAIERSYGVVILHTDQPTPEQYERIIINLLKELTLKKIVGRICRASVDQITFSDTSQ